nr:MAG TPA: hypothetical protein [Caudoviricetes sp.]
MRGCDECPASCFYFGFLVPCLRPASEEGYIPPDTMHARPAPVIALLSRSAAAI